MLTIHLLTQQLLTQQMLTQVCPPSIDEAMQVHTAS